MRGWEEVKKPILWVLAGRMAEYTQRRSTI